MTLHRLIFILFLSNSIFSYGAITITNSKTAFNLREHFKFFHDNENKFNIEEVINMNFNDQPFGGIYDGTIWAKIDYINKSTNRVFLIHYPIIIGEFQATHFSKSEIKNLYSGILNKKNDSYIKYSSPNLKINLEDEGILLFKFKYDDPVNFNVTIHSEKAFFQYDHNRQLLIGIYIGIVAILAIYILFLFISFKEVAFLVYFVCILASNVGIMTITGQTTEYLVSFEVYRHYNLGNIFGLILVISNIILSRLIFFPAIRSVGIMAIYNYLLLSSVFLCLYLIIFPTNLTISWIVNLNIMISIPFVICSFLLKKVKNSLSDNFFFLGWLLMTVTILILTFHIQGIGFKNSFFENSGFIGGALEASCFAIAVSVKSYEKIQQSYLLVREKDAAIAKITQENAVAHTLANATQHIAHDIKVPFNALKTLLTGLGTIKITEDQLTRLTSHIKKICADVDDLLSNILISGRNRINHLEPVDLNELTHEAWNTVMMTNSRKDLILDKNLNHNGLLFVDRQKVQRLLINLMTNATESMSNNATKFGFILG